MDWRDSLKNKMNDALDDLGDDLGERLEQGVASMFTQAVASACGGHIELTVDGLTLDAYALRAESSLSELGEYRIFCAAGAGLEAGSLLGKGAEWRCTSADGLERDNVGQVIQIEQGRLLPDGREEWVFTVTASLAALQQQRRHRIGHRRTVIELVQELLGEYGLTVDNRTRERYPVMEWTAQVGETDLHFLQRLLARHGIWFYSLKGEKGEILVLADDPHGASRADRGQLEVIPETGGSRSRSGSTAVALRQTRQYYRWQPDRNRVHQQVCPSEFDAHTEASHSAERKQTTQQTFFEAGSGDARDTLTRARLETERQACRAHTLRVSGAVGDLQPGQWLPIQGQGPCLVTRATLTFAAPRNHQGNTPQGFVWEAELLPLSQPYRPAIPAPPALPLVFPARVEASGPYSELDGRASRKARIGFDDGGQPLTESSPPLRQLQPHGSLPGKDGQPTGWDWPLRNGAEVLLTCLNNDPDQPVILGYAPAANQPGPVSSENGSENRLITPAGHQLKLDDRKDAQAITLNTPNGHCLLTLDASSDSPIVTLACEQGALVLRAGQHQNIEVGKTSQTRIGSDSTTQVMKRSSTQTDNGVIHYQSETRTAITANNQATLDATNNVELYSAKDTTLRIQGSATLTAKAGAAHKIGGNLHLQAADVIDIKGNGSGDLTLHQGGGGLTIKPDGTIRLFGNTVTLKSQSGVTFNGNMEYGVPVPVVADRPEAPAPKTLTPVPVMQKSAEPEPVGELVELIYVPSEETFYGLTVEETATLDAEEAILATPMKMLMEAKKSGDKGAIAKAEDKVAKEIKPFIKGASVNDLTEIVRLRGKKYTYIRSEKMKNHTRSYKLDADDRKGRALRDKDGNFDIGKVKEQLSQVNGKATWGLIDREVSGAFTDWARKINQDAKVQTDNINDPLRTYDASAEAQLLRYYGGAGLALNFNPEKAQFGIEGQASGSLALAEGKISANGYFPHAKGHHIIFDHPDADKPIKLGKVRARFEMTLAGFAGASAMGCLKLEFQQKGGALMFRGTDAGGRLSAEVLAGAKAECKAKGALEWANPDEGYQYKELASTGYKVAGQAGIGAAGSFTLSYENGRFMLRAKAGIVCGVGAQGGLEYTIDVKYISTFVAFSYHSLRDANYNTTMILQESAEEAMMALVYYMLWKGKKTVEEVRESYRGINDVIDLWRRESGEVLSRAGVVLDEIQNSPWFRYSPTGLLIRLMESFINLGEEARLEGDISLQQKVDNGLASIGNYCQSESEWRAVVHGVASRTNSSPQAVESRLAQLQLPRTNRMLALRRDVLPSIALADQPLQIQEVV